MSSLDSSTTTGPYQKPAPLFSLLVCNLDGLQLMISVSSGLKLEPESTLSLPAEFSMALLLRLVSLSFTVTMIDKLTFHIFKIISVFLALLFSCVLNDNIQLVLSESFSGFWMPLLVLYGSPPYSHCRQGSVSEPLLDLFHIHAHGGKLHPYPPVKSLLKGRSTLSRFVTSFLCLVQFTTFKCTF